MVTPWPTSSNNRGAEASETDLGCLPDAAGMFAIFCATLSAPRDMAEPAACALALRESALDRTADMPPITMPESLQDDAADLNTGDAAREDMGSAPDITAGDASLLFADFVVGGPEAQLFCCSDARVELASMWLLLL